MVGGAISFTKFRTMWSERSDKKMLHVRTECRYDNGDTYSLVCVYRHDRSETGRSGPRPRTIAAIVTHDKRVLSA